MKTENDFFDAAWDGSSLAKKRVSFLKFEPRVSNFPKQYKPQVKWLILIMQHQKIIFCFLQIFMRDVYKENFHDEGRQQLRKRESHACYIKKSILISIFV